MIPPPKDLSNPNLKISVTLLDSFQLPSFIRYSDTDVKNSYFYFSPVTLCSEFGKYTFKVDLSDSIDITTFVFQVEAKNSPPSITVVKNLIKVYEMD